MDDVLAGMNEKADMRQEKLLNALELNRLQASQEAKARDDRAKELTDILREESKQNTMMMNSLLALLSKNVDH